MPLLSRFKEGSILFNRINIPPKEPAQTDFQKNLNDILISKYTPPGVVVNERGDVEHFHGVTGAFLELNPNKPTFNVMKMARESLSYEIRNALNKVKEEGASVIRENIPIKK